MTDAPADLTSRNVVILEHYTDDDRRGAEMILATGVGEALILCAERVVPDHSLWRLTLTDDIVATIDRMEGRDSDASYTVDRGAGVVAARTLLAGDGVFDIVIAGSLFYATAAEQEADDNLKSFIERVAFLGAHLATHEAGHVLLAVTHEDGESFADLVDPTLPGALWRKHMAIPVDEHRIERMAELVTPSPQIPSEQIEDSLQHLREELNHALRLADHDMNQAALTTQSAVVGVFRDIAYTTAKLGMVDATTAHRPDPLPRDWALLEPFWDTWSIAFHELPGAHERTSLRELSNVLEGLCGVASLWLTSIGVEFRVTPEGHHTLYWTRPQY